MAKLEKLRSTLNVLKLVVSFILGCKISIFMVNGFLCAYMTVSWHIYVFVFLMVSALSIKSINIMLPGLGRKINGSL